LVLVVLPVVPRELLEVLFVVHGSVGGLILVLEVGAVGAVIEANLLVFLASVVELAVEFAGLLIHLHKRVEVARFEGLLFHLHVVQFGSVVTLE